MIALVLWLTVVDPLPIQGGLDEVRGVTGPEEVPSASTPLWRDERAWAAAIMLAAVGTALFVGRRRPITTVAEPPPEQWAAAELQRLAEAHPDADALTRFLRGFLARQYHVSNAATTREAVERLSVMGTPKTIAWRELLEHCDAIRFSRSEFSPDEWSAVVSHAQILTVETLPVGKAAASAVTGTAGEKA
jgi:hypothetical protein